jgi:hypothetical protein
MKKTNLTLTILLALLILLGLSACSIPAAAETEGEVQPTENAPTSPPDQGAVPTPPSQNGSPTQAPQNEEAQGCTYIIMLDGTPSIVEGQVFQPGESFTAEWPVRNAGSCIWTADYTLVHIAGETLGASSPSPLGISVAPGDTTTLSLQMTAPTTPGPHQSKWQLQSAGGVRFGLNSPADAPLRVIIKVAQPAVVTPAPTSVAPTPTPTSQAPAPIADALSQANDQTLTLNQCFDFVSGQDVPCSHPHADFKYTYASGQGGNLLPWNALEFSGSRTDMPSRADCEGEAYYPLTLSLALPAESTTGKYYCFQTTYDGDTIYGWIQPTDFNGGGITFNYAAYEPSPMFAPGNATQSLNLWLFTLLHGSDETMLDDQCYDLTLGQVVSCGDPDASFRYNYSVVYGGIMESKLALAFSDTQTTVPSKMSCAAATYYEEAPVTFTTHPPGVYACFRTTYNGDTVYGWVHPTAFNEDGLTFDFATYEP